MIENASPDILVAIIAASATIFASILALLVSRYYQTKREQLIAHRERKVELYDKFLHRIFELFSTENKNKIDTSALSPFLREMQINLILWAGPSVLKSYYDWHKVLTTKPPRAIQMIKMLDFFLAIRQDLGHSNRRIQRKHLARLLLRNPEWFIQEFKKNPNITFEEMIKYEPKLELLDDK
jgi:hypothetical protein